MKVSVLVPVYNLERFIAPCLESLLTQQADFDYEVIAIDDGREAPDTRRADRGHDALLGQVCA